MECFLQKMILILIRNKSGLQYRTDYKAFRFVHVIDFNSPKKLFLNPNSANFKQLNREYLLLVYISVLLFCFQPGI